MEWHKQGIENPISLEAKAHDFVIPSAYQVTPDNKENINCDINYVNAEANHLSGSSLHFDAGEENREKIIGYLSEIMK